ncbi:MAG: phosphoribosyltransferase family protein [Candidatus Micrarchaeota archaeon]
MPNDYLTKAEVLALTQKLTQQINESGFKPTQIVFIARDGEPVARLLQNDLQIPIQKIRLSRSNNQLAHRLWKRFPAFFARTQSVSVPLFRTINKIRKPRITKRLQEPVTPQERILLVDDVVGSGQTLDAAMRYLVDNGLKKSQIRTATLLKRPRYKGKDPDFFAAVSHKVTRGRNTNKSFSSEEYNNGAKVDFYEKLPNNEPNEEKDKNKAARESGEETDG